MNAPFLKAAGAALAVGLVWNALIYMLLLSSRIAAADALHDPHLVPKIVGEILIAIIFAHMWFKGLDSGSLLPQGLRFGAWAGLLYYGAGMLQTAALVDIDASLALMIGVLGVIKFITMGAAAALATGVNPRGM
jgi:hypothetical protein